MAGKYEGVTNFDALRLDFDTARVQYHGQTATLKLQSYIREAISNFFAIQNNVFVRGAVTVNDLLGQITWLDLEGAQVTNTPGAVAAAQIDIYGGGTTTVSGACYGLSVRSRGNIAVNVLDALLHLQIQTGSGPLAKGIVFMDVPAGTPVFYLVPRSGTYGTVTNAKIVAGVKGTKIPVTTAAGTQYLFAADDWINA